MTTREGLTDRFEFTKGRVNNTTILPELVTVTGLGEDDLRRAIPELSRGDLAFIGRWADEVYGDSEVGRLNANAVRDFVVLHIPKLNVAGTATCDLTGINLSYAIDTANGVVTGAEAFDGAEDYLEEHFATARMSVEGLAEALSSQLPPDLGTIE